MDVFLCEVCMGHMGEGGRWPRVLGCGHSICSLCAYNLVRDGVLVCHMCCAPHPVTASHEIPLNHMVLKILNSSFVRSLSNSESFKNQTNNHSAHGAHTPEDLQARNSPRVNSNSGANQQGVADPQENQAAVEPSQHAGICDEHNQYLVYWCLRCAEWICHDCILVKHPYTTCSITSFRQCLTDMQQREDWSIKNTVGSFDKHLMNYRLKHQSLKELRDKHRKQIKDLQIVLSKHQKAERALEKEDGVLQSAMSDGLGLCYMLLESQGHLLEAQSLQQMLASRQSAQECQNAVLGWYNPVLLRESDQVLYSKELHRSTAVAMAVMKENMSTSCHVLIKAEADNLTPISAEAKAELAQIISQMSKGTKYNVSSETHDDTADRKIVDLLTGDTHPFNEEMVLKDGKINHVSSVTKEGPFSEALILKPTILAVSQLSMKKNITSSSTEDGILEGINEVGEVKGKGNEVTGPSQEGEESEDDGYKVTISQIGDTDLLFEISETVQVMNHSTAAAGETTEGANMQDNIVEGEETAEGVNIEGSDQRTHETNEFEENFGSENTLLGQNVVDTTSSFNRVAEKTENIKRHNTEGVSLRNSQQETRESATTVVGRGICEIQDHDDKGGDGKGNGRKFHGELKAAGRNCIEIKADKETEVETEDDKGHIFTDKNRDKNEGGDKDEYGSEVEVAHEVVEDEIKVVDKIIDNDADHINRDKFRGGFKEDGMDEEMDELSGKDESLIKKEDNLGITADDIWDTKGRHGYESGNKLGMQEEGCEKDESLIKNEDNLGITADDIWDTKGRHGYESGNKLGMQGGGCEKDERIGAVDGEGVDKDDDDKEGVGKASGGLDRNEANKDGDGDVKPRMEPTEEDISSSFEGISYGVSGYPKENVNLLEVDEESVEKEEQAKATKSLSPGGKSSKYLDCANQ